MKKTIYNTIGVKYNEHRNADKRILYAIKKILNLPAGSTIADIGAGSGNYTNALAELGYKIKAIEPSETMRNQAKENNRVEWLPGTAESIPLPDNSVNGIVITLAIHHFSSLQASAKEMYRICPLGPIVLFTFDPRESEHFWLIEYFPEIWQQAFELFPPINEVADLLSNNNQWIFEIERFPLPNDLSDKFMAYGWGKPELYLDENIRKSMSGFALANPDVVRNGVNCLEKDLKSGKWDKKYGSLRNEDYFDAGYRFIKLKYMA